MRVTEEDFQLRLPRDSHRSRGLHLSDILRDLALKIGVLAAKFDTPIVDEGSETIQIGLAWEDYLAKYQHVDVEFHPGELLYEGIAMSPDGIGVETVEDLTDVVIDDAWVLWEYKATRKSSRDFKEMIRLKSKKVLMWLWQIQAYRHAMNMTVVPSGCACRVAKLGVMFLNGNYSKDFDDPESRPTYKLFRLEFTQEELDNNWEMIMSHARSMGVINDERE